MYNYIRAELYRNFNRKYLWVYTGFFAFASLAINLLASVNEGNSAISLNILFGITIAMFIMPVYLVVPMLDMATAEENKNQTLRNVITFGMPRNKIVLSKVIVAVVLSLISAAIVLVVFFGSGAVLFGLGKDFSATLSDFLIRLLAVLPLWIGAIALGTFLAIIIGNNMFTALYLGLFLFLPGIIKVLARLISDKLMYVHKVLISTQIGNITAENASSKDLITGALIGTAYIVVFTALSMLYFKKKEIK